jgi:hypothetical protein
MNYALLQEFIKQNCDATFSLQKELKPTQPTKLNLSYFIFSDKQPFQWYPDGVPPEPG